MACKILFILLFMTTVHAIPVCEFERDQTKIQFSWKGPKQIELNIQPDNVKCTANLVRLFNGADSVSPHYRMTFSFEKCEPTSKQVVPHDEWVLLVHNPKGRESDYTLSWSDISAPDTCTVKNVAAKSAKPKRTAAGKIAK